MAGCPSPKGAGLGSPPPEQAGLRTRHQRRQERIATISLNEVLSTVPPDYQSGQSDLKLADAVNSNAKTTTADRYAARDVGPPERGEKSPRAPNRPPKKVIKHTLCPTGLIVGTVRHYGPRSWIPRNSDSSMARCSLARVVGARV